MTAASLIHCQWDGESFIPTRHALRAVDQHFVVGEHYCLTEWQERSSATHNHEFAWLKEAWQNLPEGIADLYPSPEHLRKRALIEAGFYDEEIVDASTNAAALRVAGFVRKRDEFSLVIVRGPLVIVRTAKSQSRRAMDKKDFQASKAAIMEVVAHIIGVSPSSLTREAGRAA